MVLGVEIGFDALLLVRACYTGCWLMVVHDLKSSLVARAHDLGLHAVGVTTAEPFGARAGSRSNNRPDSVLPGAKSIVAVALSYYYRPACPECEDGISDEPRGRVSRFAWASDYHLVVQTRLEALGAWLKQECGADSVVCVDTGPLLDRAAAQRAGIGWYGKNSMIFVRRYGSWVVLGELVTTAELTPDEPCEEDHCGSCELCLKSCPTGAIVAPGVVDAGRCLSHLTQMKGYAPRELRPLIEDRVYGCDTCQDVCPQNRNVFPTDAPELARICPPGRKPPLISLVRISPEEFKASISGNTMGWIKRTRIRRNAIVALGNIGDPSAIPGLVEALADEEPLIRGHAAWAIGRIGSESQSRAAVEKALAVEGDSLARHEMQEALEDMQ